MSKILQGAARITSGLKEYGHGKSMEAGLRRLTAESKQAGVKEGFEKGVQYALQKMSLTERLFGASSRTRHR